MEKSNTGAPKRRSTGAVAPPDRVPDALDSVNASLDSVHTVSKSDVFRRMVGDEADRG